MVKLCHNKPTVSHVEQVHQRQFLNSVAINVGMSVANMLPQILSGMFSSSSVEEPITPSDPLPVSDPTPVEEPSGVDLEKDNLSPQEKIDTVVKLIQTKKPKFTAKSSYIDKLVSNYDLYKDVYKLSDDDLTTRLCAYYDALISHDVQKYYGDFLSNAQMYVDMYIESTGTPREEFTEDDYQKILDLCKEKEGQAKRNMKSDKNSAITNEIAKGNGIDDSSYLQAQINRGIGYVDLYDTNHDRKVDFNEFCALEAKDSGVRELSPEEREATKEFFNIIDKNGDTYIDAKEMASHLYGIATLNDIDKDTSNDISIAEWSDAQNPDNWDKLIIGGTRLYDKIKDM